MGSPAGQRRGGERSRLGPEQPADKVWACLLVPGRRLEQDPGTCFVAHELPRTPDPTGHSGGISSPSSSGKLFKSVWGPPGWDLSKASLNLNDTFVQRTDDVLGMGETPAETQEAPQNKGIDSDGSWALWPWLLMPRCMSRGQAWLCSQPPDCGLSL